MLLAAHALGTWFMVGLIWFVQAVHNPLFDAVADAGRAYARRQSRRTTWVVAPVMSLQRATALWLAVLPPAHLTGSWLPGGGPEVVARLVRSNWLRTVAWTARGVLTVAMLPRSGPGPTPERRRPHPEY